MKTKLAKITVLMLVVGLLAVTMAIAGEESIIGVVEKTDQGIVIAAEDGASYLVQGENLEAMVGKTLKATGTLAESDQGKVITITDFEVVTP